MNDNNRLGYKVNEAAAALGVHPITVYRWLTDGIIKGVRVGPKLWRIPQSEIDRMRVPFDEAPSGEDAQL